MVDSISRITSALESARELTLEAAAVASSRLGETSYHRYSQKITPEGLRSLLNSRNEREVRDGMKRVASLLASDDPTIDLELYFADVVKNIGSSNDIKVKRLIAVYLLRYAERQPNVALLAVNSIQKSLTDPDPQSRALALKMLSDIKIPSLYPIVLHSVKKSVSDSAPEVRSAVSFALLKLYREQRETVADDVKPLLVDLLSDTDPLVVSSALLLLKEAFPQSLDLLHGHFRRYCKILPQLSQWSQAYLIDLLIDYCKTFIPRPILTDSLDTTRSMPLPDAFNAIPFATYDVALDPDLELFLQTIQKMLHSPSAAVIVSISKALFELSPPVAFKNSRITHVLARLISAPSFASDRGVILQCILVYCAVDPTTFSPFLKKFFLFPSDDTATAVNKLKIIATLVNLNNVKKVVLELKYHIVHDKRPSVIQEALKSIAACGQLSQSLSLHITKWLLVGMETSIVSTSLDSYVNVVRYLIQENPTQHLGTMVHLAKTLKTEKKLSGNAKAGIIWLFGEFSATNFSICPDVLRILVPGFSSEPRETRSQIVLFAAKILSCDLDNFKNSRSEDESYDFDQSRISQMAQAVFHLAKFDDDFDIRDRARMFSSLFDKQRYEIASLLLQAPKPASMCSLTFDAPISLSAANLAHLNIDHDMEEYLTTISWSEDQENNKSSELRKPAELKDYNKLKTSFSSSSFFAGKDNQRRSSSIAENQNSSKASSSRVFTSSIGKKYHLQSLDEFFSDVPSKEHKTVKRGEIEQESTSDEGSSSEDNLSEQESDSGDYESTDSSDSDVDDESDSNSDGDEERSL
ncbi:LANO_0C08482g1_1 [Lachancea nothofagi CBS 11611]|uniref:LANO_0C08482g1_1 n=1 Tax=Lachancea nothofagi CBS 11611 TaxID=1266666 RepID=A0A1G4J9C9_9SACH|nr:LANO_0C08482g1_1 [Lachancea nothofagi CBS 11611]